MQTAFSFSLSSQLNAPAAVVWQRVSTLAGVNEELAPILHMTAPLLMRQRSFMLAQPGQVLFPSWLLLFGFLPYDRHYLRLEQIWDGGFIENSYSWFHRVWHHERRITACESGCKLTDTLRFEPRFVPIGYLLLPLIRSVFHHRHRHLRQWFGSTDFHA